MEALVSTLLGTIVVLLVSSVFLVQNEFYADSVKRSVLQESIRSAAALVSAELRAVAAGGVVVAEPDSVVYRVPLVVGGICAINSTESYLLLPLDGDSIDSADVAGYAVRDTLGSWTYNTATWASIHHSSGATPAATCRTAGADTVGARDDFYRLDGLAGSPQPGDLVMIYGQLVLKVATSELDSVTTALFRGNAGETPVEYANSMAPSSAFAYRLSSSSSFQSQVTGGDLANIVEVRFSALGALPASRAGRDSLSFDLTVSVPLGNAY